VVLQLGAYSNCRPTTPSTMSVGMRELQEGAPHGTLVLAEAQTEGRGRGGRSWQSNPAGNLYFSLVVRPQCVWLDAVCFEIDAAAARSSTC
jgi:BirA family biotin operon repressor/biotin-[acetyl-CoA-carboxylase] ligase